MIGSLLRPELAELIRERNFTQLREILCNFPAPEVAEILGDLTPDDKAVLLRILPHDLATEAFEYLSVEDQESLLHALGTEQVASILNDLPPDDRTALLEELPSAALQKLLALLNPHERKIATDLLGYPKDSIGRRMTPEYVAVNRNWTAEEVLAQLRRESSRRDAINQLYVVDDKGALLDRVRLRDVVVADPKTPLSDLLENQNFALRATDDQETAVGAFRKYDVTILPVVDSKGVLVGVVTVDDVLDVAEQEATEDIQKLGGSEALDEPYLTIALSRMIRKRAPWLVVLFLSEMLTSTAMTFFQDEISKAVVLAVFLPLIISSGGNSGSQATTLIIRAVAIGEVSLIHWWRVMRREVLTGAVLGAILGVIGFVRISIWHYAFHSYGPHWVLVAVTIGISLFGVVLWGSLSGAMLPFVLKRCGLDPAASSAPFVATLVDVTGIMIYFHVALWTLSGTLLAPPAQGTIALDYKPTPDTMSLLLHLTPEWEVEKVNLNTNRNTLTIEIKEADDFGKLVHCEGCNGDVEVTGHEGRKVWDYPDIFGYHTEIVSQLPQLKCKTSEPVAKPCPLAIPWEDKGRLKPAI